MYFSRNAVFKDGEQHFHKTARTIHLKFSDDLLRYKSFIIDNYRRNKTFSNNFDLLCYSEI